MIKRYFGENLSFILIVFTLLTVIIGGILYIRLNNREIGYTRHTAEYNETIKQKNTTGKEEVIKFKNDSEVVLEENSSVVEISKKAGPSVVGIRSTITGLPIGLLSGDVGKPVAEGSGIIISEEGYILTNYHVVQFADPRKSYSRNIALEVFLPDGRQTEAEFIGGDRKEDLAVIKVKLQSLPVAEIGDSSKLQVGELVVAIGNPLGIELAGSVTVGYVSALNRIIAVNDIYLRLIQTDAAINPGNSGGALVNSKGQVIGVNSVKISVPGVEGLGFAIPINDAKRIAEQLVMYGYVKERPSIGIDGKEVTQVVSRLLGIPEGVFVLKVEPESGADKAGIRKGDVIIAIDNRPVRTVKDMYTIEKEHEIGDVVETEIMRDGRRLKLQITIS